MPARPMPAAPAFLPIEPLSGTRFAWRPSERMRACSRQQAGGDTVRRGGQNAAVMSLDNLEADPGKAAHELHTIVPWTVAPGSRAE